MGILIKSIGTIPSRPMALACLALLSCADAPAVAGTYSVLYRFHAKGEGGSPANGVAVDTDGTLYGMTIEYGNFRCGTVFSLAKPGVGGTQWALKVLHQIGPNTNECYARDTPTIQGDFVAGTTSGSRQVEGPPFGNVFLVRKAGGAYSVLHTFDGKQGKYPLSGLLAGTDGRLLYGTTPYSGPLDCPHSSGGDGVLYQTGRSGGFKVLHNFGPRTGIVPKGELTYGPDGAIYGTAAGSCNPNSYGVVFRLSTDGAYSVLYDFPKSAEPVAAGPTGRLAVGPDGTLYGTTQNGGSKAGTAYSLTPGAQGAPWTFKVLHEFSPLSDGSYPGGLVRDDAGNLYGTTLLSGPKSGGTLFRLSPPTAGGAWTFANLRAFAAKSPEGSSPNSDLVLKNGVLYGMTRRGGDFELRQYGSGTVFSYSLP